MKLIVGLGNPTKEYEKTRHNVGFDVLDEYAKKHNLEFTKTKFQGLYTENLVAGEKVILLKPQKYMNLSGEVVGEFVNYFKIPIDDVLVIADDLDIETARIRLRKSGHSGGHNGLKNIELHLGTTNYKRLKIGIANDKLIDTKDYVLGKFNKEDRELIDKSIKIAVDIIDDYLIMSFDNLMNKYN